MLTIPEVFLALSYYEFQLLSNFIIFIMIEIPYVNSYNVRLFIHGYLQSIPYTGRLNKLISCIHIYIHRG